MSNSANRLPLRTRLAFGAGDLYGGGATTIISMYYLYFLTDVMGINPGLAGTAFLVSKIWDAVTDPFMGIISDNTRTRWGRRRPYFFAGIFLIFFSFVLMWAPMPIAREGMKFLYVVIAYLFFSTVYTMVWVPYNAIATELTSDFDERTRLSTYRMIFSNVSGILAGVLAKDVFVSGLFPDDAATGFFVMSIAFGLFFALPYIATFLYCKEDPEAMNAPRRKIGNVAEFISGQLITPFRLRPFRFVSMMFLFGFMAQDAVMALAVYFITYYLKIGSMMTLLVPVYGFMLLAIPVADRVANRIGKRKTYMAACVLWVLSFGLIPFMSSTTPVVLVYAFGALFGAAAAGIQVMVFAMFPDVPDADELFSGVRREGLYSGMFAFLRKTGGAVVMFLIGQGIKWAGYLQPVNGVQQEQTATFLAALIGMLIGIPVIFICIAFIACRLYPLTRDRHRRLQSLLTERRHEPALSPGLAQEESALKVELGNRPR